MSRMSDLQMTVAFFGEAERRLWGMLRTDERPELTLASLDGRVLLRSEVEVVREPDVWTVTAAGCDLRLEPAEPAAATEHARETLTPVRLAGRVSAGTEERELDLPGVLTSLTIDPQTASLRLLTGWFAGGHELALRAARRRGSKGHDSDSVEVIAMGEEQPQVFDARLSTTYDAAGLPRSAGIELWIGADEDGDQYARRLSGVASGPVLSSTLGGLRLDAFLFDCLSRGELGSGVYALALPA